MKRWIARGFILCMLTAMGVVGPDTERTTYEPLTGGVLTPGRPVVPRTVPRPVVALPDLSAASGVLDYQPAAPRPATAKPAATTPPATARPLAPAAPTWEMIFDEWSHKLPGHWSVQDDGNWGMTTFDLNETVHIARRTPSKYLKAIMLHESMHVRQIRVFAGDYDAAVAALAPYGGVEVNADCGAALMGANFLTYVKGKCTAEQLRAATAIMQERKP